MSYCSVTDNGRPTMDKPVRFGQNVLVRHGRKSSGLFLVGYKSVAIRTATQITCTVHPGRSGRGYNTRKALADP